MAIFDKFFLLVVEKRKLSGMIQTHGLLVVRHVLYRWVATARPSGSALAQVVEHLRADSKDLGSNSAVHFWIALKFFSLFTLITENTIRRI